MNYRRYLIFVSSFTLLSTVILFGIFWPNYSYALGIVWGSIGGSIGFWLLYSAVDNMPLRDLGDTKRTLRRNKMIRFAIYSVFVMIAVFLPSIFSVFTTILSLIMVKFLLVISEMTVRKRP